VRDLLTIIGVCVAIGACSAEKRPEVQRKDLGTEVGETASDTKALQAASAAVNDVARNAADCTAARPSIATAYQTLDEVAPTLKTATGVQMLATLRKRVDEVAQACP
jgi:hypothetical protein